MKIAIIAIGNEILRGQTVNSNAAFIAKELVKIGLLVDSHQVLPDDERVLREGLTRALDEYDLVITTGGLGPTFDDLTRKVAAELFQSEFVFNQDLADDLFSRYGDKLTSLKDQSTVPEKALILDNQVGTAPGFIFKEKSLLVLPPGVPPEMREMMTTKVIPYLDKQIKLKEKHYHKHLNFCRLPEIAVDPTLRSLQIQYPEVDFGIYPSLGMLGVHLQVKAATPQEGESKLKGPFEALKAAFSDHIFEKESLEEAIQEACIRKGITLALAESCTGGLISAKLTAIADCSHYFKGSIVAYSNQAKIDLLDVSPYTLEKAGAVSELCVKEMAKEACLKLQSDYAIAVSGIAGPGGGSQEKPVGTVCCSLFSKDHEIVTWTFMGRGTRETIILRSVNEVLSVFWQKVCR